MRFHFLLRQFRTYSFSNCIFIDSATHLLQLFNFQFSRFFVCSLHRCFDQVCLHKPNTSRPANSERYIICKGKRPQMEAIRDYLFEINCRLNEIGFNLNGGTESSIDVLEIVPLSLLLGDHDFVEYLRNSNDILGKFQFLKL